MHLVLAQPVCQILKVNVAPEPKSLPTPALICSLTVVKLLLLTALKL